MKYNKLVRDKIPEILRLRGINYNSHIAKEEEYLEKLKEKYFEEMKEFFEENDKVELADILEITYAFRDYFDIDEELLEDLAKKAEYNKHEFQSKIKKFTKEPDPKKLGEVLGIIYSACDKINISKGELENLREIKAETKGRFLDKIILEETRR